jgi:hypothetical protein
MTPKQIAKNLIRDHFSIGSLTWEESIECALTTSRYMNAPDIQREIDEVKNRDARITCEKKSNDIVQLQMELF